MLFYIVNSYILWWKTLFSRKSFDVLRTPIANKKLKVILDWTYLVCSMIGALCVALNIGIGAYGYILFLISSVIGLFLALRGNSSISIVWVNMGFIVTNIIGLVRFY